MRQRKKILSQMFDVKPVNPAGEVDYIKIKTIRKIVSLKIEGSEAAGQFQKIFPSKLRRSIAHKRAGSFLQETKNKKTKIKFKAKTIQFNRFAFRRDQEIPYLLKSDYIPNFRKTPCADVVSRADDLPKRIISITTTPTFGSVRRKALAGFKIDSGLIKNKKTGIGGFKSVKSLHNKELEEKFSRFFKKQKSPLQLRDKKPIGKKVRRKDIPALMLPKKQTVRTKRTKPPTTKNLQEKQKSTEAKKSFWRLLASNYKNNSSPKPFIRPALQFFAFVFGSLSVLGGVLFFSVAFQIKEDVEVRGKQALGYIAKAQEDLSNQDFVSAGASFGQAREELEKSEESLNSLGGDVLNIFQNMPFFSKISSGKNVVEAGNHLLEAAEELSKAALLFSELENPLREGGDSKSMTGLFLNVRQNIAVAKASLAKADEHMSKVKIEDLPSDNQSKFELIKKSLPLVVSLVEKFDQNSQIFQELLGNNGPRKYLFLFQNNQEMRATGGFIGTYGLLDVSNGEVRSLLIDGIFNPDGQLKTNVVPPKPIQKISAAWSTHDANWYPNFPSSAEKIAWFYEKTGGPTVDGIITLTPTVLKKMLDITGPIVMEEYGGLVIDAGNFVAKTQYEVEVNYDKELNQPKKFIADLAPQILNKLFSQKDPIQISKAAAVLGDALKERHILLYSFDQEIQSAISRQGWSGEILNSEKDYLMVVNSNINGFKTDGIIEEKIEHKADIQTDGSIISTVKITRKHNGGDSQYEWWNKVNSNYMRVYVPKGSQLISAKGYTREVFEQRIDYEKLRFEVHSDVIEQEKSMVFDQETGTAIYDEEEKTVFANWVYVSPKESATIEYSYLLPFKIDLSKNEESADTYSLLVQKQSGSLGSEFSSVVGFEEKFSPIWTHPAGVKVESGEIKSGKKLEKDFFIGIVFQDSAIQSGN